MFYCFFHLWLNILAELLRFGDREFYKDWWNAKTVEEYWRMWNMPVHKWMVRHIYFPCLRNGIPKGVAVLISFVVSAIFHELCIAVPCHIFKFWAFIGIMLQVPLVMITSYLQDKFSNSMVGNMIFWCFFSIFGQPMCLLLYYHDLMNRKVNTAWTSSWKHWYDRTMRQFWNSKMVPHEVSAFIVKCLRQRAATKPCVHWCSIVTQTLLLYGKYSYWLLGNILTGSNPSPDFL